MGGDSIVPAKLKRGCGCVGTCQNKCDEGCCFSASVSDDVPDGDQSGPCRDFRTATSDQANYTGVYDCTGGADDEGTWTWPGGSHFKPANQPDVGPCYGASNTAFIANMQEGQKMKCQAGSWGGGVGCNLNCCLQQAP
jgi:hypothetical protein